MGTLSLRRFSKSLDDRVPDGLGDAMRSGVLAFGRLTANLRMKPEFLIVGGQRCGTTTMFRLLSGHPDVVRPTLSKGIGYFDVNYQMGAGWYAGHFPLRPLQRSGRNRVAFESSGYYSYHPLAAERIANDLPGVKLVMLVRDPVERAHSAYKHEFRRGFETESFERALELEPERLMGEVEKIVADPAYESFSHRHHSYVGRGMYADQLERMVNAVGRDNVLAIDANAFFSRPEDNFGKLIEWLGLSPWVPESVGQENATAEVTMSQDTYTWLRKQFEEADARLTDHLGHIPSWRTEG